MPLARPLFGEGYPLFEGSLAVPEPPPASVNLAGVDYLIDLAKYRRSGIPTLRDNTVTSGEPDDQLFDSQGAWWRYRSSWSSGAGQQRVDLGQRSNAARFSTSRGVDVWDDYSATLLHATELVDATASDADSLRLIAVDTFVYYTDGTDVFRSSDLITWNTVTGLVGSVNDLSTDGTDCFIATTDDLYRVSPGALAASAVTSAVAPGSGYDSVAFAGNRIMASAGAELYEVLDASLITVLTHRQAAFVWTTVFSIGSRIYAGGFAGNRSELITLQTLSDGSLAPGPEAAPLGPGELLRTALSYGGAALLGTSLGIRFSQVGGDGSLTYGPLIDAPGDVRCIAAEGRYAWFGWSSFIDGGSGVGRLDLAELPADLQPAYASDVYTDDDSDIVHGVARFGDRTVFLLAANGVYASIVDEYVTTGYLDVGEIYFGTVERKALTQIQLRFAELAASETFAVALADENGDSVGSGSVATLAASGLELDLEGIRADFTTMRITLTGPGTTTPSLRLWRARAYPVAPAVERWLVPIILHSAVVMGEGDGARRDYDVLAEAEQIIALWRSKEVIGYREGSRTYRVRINNYELESAKWRDQLDFFESTLTVELFSV
jgi:hypothetical protein